MKRIIFLGLLLSFNAFANKETKSILAEYKNECKTTTVTVEEVVKNSHIKGHINGLPVAAYDKFKVVFYVKTDAWYVHPYTYNEGQQEGYSYSNLKADGSFWVRTIQRDVPAQKLAVVLVPRSYKITNKKYWLKPLFGFLGGVLKNQCNHSIVPGNGDFFN